LAGPLRVTDARPKCPPVFPLDSPDLGSTPTLQLWCRGTAGHRTTVGRSFLRRLPVRGRRGSRLRPAARPVVAWCCQGPALLQPCNPASLLLQANLPGSPQGERGGRGGGAQWRSDEGFTSAVSR
jgi:hypothetical protein